MMTMSRAISAGQALDYYKKEFTNSQDNYYREAGEVQACRVSRAVRMVKESLRPETIQLGRCKEFFRSQASRGGGKDSFAPKESLTLLAFRTSERKPDTTRIS